MPKQYLNTASINSVVFYFFFFFYILEKKKFKFQQLRNIQHEIELPLLYQGVLPGYQSSTKINVKLKYR